MPRMATPSYEIPNLTGGVDDVLVDIVGTVPSFIPMFLLFVWGIIFIGGSVSQKRRLGTADLPMWASISSLATFMIALPLTLTTGLISLATLSVVITITIVSALWLFLSKTKFEQ